MWFLLAVILESVGLLGGHPVVQKGLASGYTPYAKEQGWVGRQRIQMSSGKPFCAWFGYKAQGQPTLAHRSWPCGTRVWVWCPRTKKGAWATIIDRGPYGAIGHRTEGLYCGHRTGKGKEWCVKRPLRMVAGVLTVADPGKWRGIADLSPELRALLGHSGWEFIRLVTSKKEIRRAWLEFKNRQPTS